MNTKFTIPIVKPTKSKQIHYNFKKYTQNPLNVKKKNAWNWESKRVVDYSGPLAMGGFQRLSLSLSLTMKEPVRSQLWRFDLVISSPIS